MSFENACITGDGDAAGYSAQKVRMCLAASPPPGLPPYSLPQQQHQHPGGALAMHCSTFAMAGMQSGPLPWPPAAQHLRPAYYHQAQQQQHLQPAALQNQATCHPATTVGGGTYFEQRPADQLPKAHEGLPFLHSMKPPAPRPSPSPSPPPLPPPPLPSVKQQQHQQQPSGLAIAQNAIPSITGVRQGELLEGVGLLPSLQADFMKTYEKPPKGRRAPREDLTSYTAEEKVERRKARARIYSDIARKRQEAINDKLKRDIVYMRSFREVVEQAPCSVAVLAADLEARVLYCNGAFGYFLHVPAAHIMGTSLWDWIHSSDRARLQTAFNTAILAKAAPVRRARCRMLCQRQGQEGSAVGVQVGFRRGTQGIVCTIWVESEQGRGCDG